MPCCAPAIHPSLPSVAQKPKAALQEIRVHRNAAQCRRNSPIASRGPFSSFLPPSSHAVANLHSPKVLATPNSPAIQPSALPLAALSLRTDSSRSARARSGFSRGSRGRECVVEGRSVSEDPFLHRAFAQRSAGGQLDHLDGPQSAGYRNRLDAFSRSAGATTRVRSVFTLAPSPRAQSRRPAAPHRATRRRPSRRREKCAEFRSTVQTLAYPLPVMVIAEMLARFPIGDYEKIKRRSDDFAASLAPQRQRPTSSSPGRESPARGNSGIFRWRRRRPAKDPREYAPGEDCSCTDGPAGRHDPRGIFPARFCCWPPAAERQRLNLIGNGMCWRCLQNPDQWQKLVDHPELIESTVEEMLRFDSPVQWTSRMTAMEMEIGDQNPRRGDRAGQRRRQPPTRDPARFRKPSTASTSSLPGQSPPLLRHRHSFLPGSSPGQNGSPDRDQRAGE